jgi:hydroxyethylthiazole kinase-like sugar kinase family protein
MLACLTHFFAGVPFAAALAVDATILAEVLLVTVVTGTGFLDGGITVLFVSFAAARLFSVCVAVVVFTRAARL